jgi:hypothetical protein
MALYQTNNLLPIATLFISCSIRAAGIIKQNRFILEVHELCSRPPTTFFNQQNPDNDDKIERKIFMR